MHSNKREEVDKVGPGDIAAVIGLILLMTALYLVLPAGLHSYGFGTGAVVRYLFLVGAIDLAIVGLCSIVYAARGGLRLKSSPKGLWQPT